MKQIIIKSNYTIYESMQRLNSTSEKCLIVVDDNNTLLGTLTDGDIRRAIFKGNKFTKKISSIFNQKPICLFIKDYNKKIVKELFIKNGIDLIPIVNYDKQVIDYVTWGKLGLKKNRDLSTFLNIPLVIMAGGKGKRLDPFTKILPKPLIPINDKPIIDHIIEKFLEFGFHNMFIMSNYKSKILSAFFEEKEAKYNVTIIKENIPLGTVGSLLLLKDKLETPVFVTNCDTLINTDYSDVYKFHQKNAYELTIVVCAKEHFIPYGVCTLNKNGSLHDIKEKPSYDLLINTGFYVINPSIIQLIPKNKKFHFTDLIEKSLKLKKNIGVFPVYNKDWLDIGQWSEYQKAEDFISSQ